MALINLDLIERLANAAEPNYLFAENFCYRPNNKIPPISESLFVQHVYTHVQAKNLFSSLKRLKQVCTDFAAGNFQPYRDRHYEGQEELDEAVRSGFDPFVTLDACFNTMSVADLPYEIERYKELVALCHSFADNRQTSLAWIDMATSDPTFADGLKPEHEILDIETAYCLDRYNEFYETATGLLADHMGNDVQQCAIDILALFGPRKANR